MFGGVGGGLALRSVEVELVNYTLGLYTCNEVEGSRPLQREPTTTLEDAQRM